MRLLIIDDDDDDVRLARAALTIFEITHASNSSDAIREIKNLKAHLCLIDYSYSESHRMVHVCATHGIPAIFWSGLLLPKPHRMFLSKDLLLSKTDALQNQLLKLINNEPTETQ